MNYDPSKWYWFVGGDTTQAWSSEKAAFVPADDVDFEAWLANGYVATAIDSIESLGDVLVEQYLDGAPMTANVAAARQGVLMASANAETVGMTDAYVAGLLDAADTTSFKAWAAYKLELSKVDLTAPTPSWPTLPTA